MDGRSPPPASPGYPAITATRKTGEEPIIAGDGAAAGLRLADFWAWSASDLLSNATRGILAEYLVAAALGLADGVRAEWDAYDLRTREKTKVEVKSAAYLQTWYHRELSKIRFGIRPTRAWDAATNLLDDVARIQADVYVFCVLKHQEKASVNPLDLRQWEFHVLHANVLRERAPAQRSISLVGVLALGATTVRYEELASAVKAVASSAATTSFDAVAPGASDPRLDPSD
ncbi:MAG: hypothetical protein JWM27_3079 [Gemmatimonadetes bacterium]|nr:hypothetical protein [Gemmatimonadota bacterium]